MRTVVIVGLLGVSASACQFPKPTDVPSDAGPIDAPTDARPELVQGSWKYRHMVGDTVTDGPLDLSAFTVQAWIQSGSAFTPVGGVAHADGSFEIDNVPPGAAYILRVGRSAFVTDQHTLTLRNSIPTRANVVAATQPTPVRFQLDGLAPIEIADEIVAFSRTADIEATLVAKAGSTELDATVDWMNDTFSAYTRRAGLLPEAAAGDDFAVLHFRTNAVTAGPDDRIVQQIIAAGDLSTTTLRDGEARTIQATLTTPIRTFSAPSIALAPYAAGHSPLTRPGQVYARCGAVPGPAVDRQSNGGAHIERPIVTFNRNAPLPASMDLSGSFGDPFPTSWARYCSVTVTRERLVRVPGTSTAFGLGGFTERVALASALIGTPTQPPTAIRVRGLDGDRGGLLRNDGEPVVITWTGSAQATQYAVEVYQVVAQGSQTTPRFLISIATSEPTLTVPAEFLTGADFVVFVVTAVNSTNAYATGTLTPSGVPGGSASAATAMFRWSATCGDSTPDVGEACDEGSETAVCDSDCTTAACGDGTRNVAAGELCDTIVDTPGCDSDCTANTCGDGHVNAETEQCDDGGTAPGDGCSATCQTE